jgi:glycine dehydrogenase subunit 1
MRYFPHTPADIQEMLQFLGMENLDSLFADIPETCRWIRPMKLPAPMNEWELNRHMDTLAETMAIPPRFLSFLGAGRYHHHIPEVVQALKGRSEFLTSYTPYQPEVSQGTLQAIYEYQTLAGALMGTDVTTASHYDGATAMAESALMAIRITRRSRIAVSSLVHPHYRQVLHTYLKPTGYPVIEIPHTPAGQTDLSALPESSDLAAVVLQSPNFMGCIEPISQASEIIHAHGGLCIAGFTEALALGLIRSPGIQGADIVFGEGQSLGLPCTYGGPGLGMMGSKASFLRNLPGRLVGKTTDKNGRTGFVLTLATREQHIRREKATSNICSNNSHCALTASIYMALLGGTGIRKLARINHSKAAYLQQALREAGASLPLSAPFFNEFIVRFPGNSDKTHDRLQRNGILAGVPIERFYPEFPSHYLLAVTEMVSRKEMDRLVREVIS